ITFGNRHATELLPLSGVSATQLADAALYASLADDTPEGKSIVQLVQSRAIGHADTGWVTRYIEFSATTRLSRADLRDGRVRKGAVDAVLKAPGAAAHAELQQLSDRIARAGGTPLAVSRDGRLLGVIALTDVVKPGIKTRFEELRRMGIR